MLFRGIGPARPKGGDDDKLEVTPPRSSGSVSLQSYTPRTQTGFDSGGSQGQTCDFPPGFAHFVTKWALLPLHRRNITHQRSAPDGCIQSEYGEGKKHLYNRKLSQGRNNKNRMTQPPWGRKDLDWCILSSCQSFCRCFIFDIKQDKLVLSVHLFLLQHWNVCAATTVSWCQPAATKSLGDLEVIGHDDWSGFKP